MTELGIAVVARFLVRFKAIDNPNNALVLVQMRRVSG